MRPTVKQPRSLVAVLLVLATAAVYWPVLGYGFIDYDDPGYVSSNPRVLAGLSGAGFVWAFTTTQESNWHPLTWLSLMLDAQIQGSGPRGFHRTNLLLHLASTVLLFLLFHFATGLPWRSGFVAGLFALHPLHVESVAWIAERKDVLSGLFWFLTMVAYVAYVRRPGPARYALVVVAFGVGLLAKPMLVSLPLVLLLFDIWPLRRVTIAGRGKGAADWAGLIREKAPLFTLAAASCAATLIAQRRGTAMGALNIYPLGVRLENALLAAAGYLGKMLWPRRLSVFYPYHADLPAQKVLAAGLLLAGLTALAVRFSKSRPYILLGWLWFLVTLLPVIGLVQVGSQAMADRYTYIPLVGPFVAVAWGVPDLLAAAWARAGGRPRADGVSSPDTAVSSRPPSAASRSAALSARAATAIPLPADHPAVRATPAPALAILAAALAALAALAVLTAGQVSHWHDTFSLFTHALQVDPDNPVAHNNIGTELFDQGRAQEAAEQFGRAVAAGPLYLDFRCNLVSALLQAKRLDEALAQAREAVRLWPRQVRPRVILGLVLMEQGRLDEAASHLSEAVRIDPEFLDAHLNLGIVLASKGRLGEALAQFTEALRLHPEDAVTRRLYEQAVAEKKTAEGKAAAGAGFPQ